jgi:hypothetical protein
MSRRFYPEVLGFRAGDPEFGSLPSNPKSFERQADRFVTSLLLRQTTFTTDLSGQLQGPATGRLAEGQRTLMQQGA